MGIDQLVRVGKLLYGSFFQTDGYGGAFTSQVTLYYKTLGVAIAQTSHDWGRWIQTPTGKPDLD